MEVSRTRALVCAALFWAFIYGTAVFGQKNASYAIVEGTVFRDPGFALADAKVVIEPAGSTGKKAPKKQQTTTNYRGEFVFRVPAVEAKYTVSASMKGFKGDQKEASIAGGGVPGSERVAVNLVLAPDAK